MKAWFGGINPYSLSDWRRYLDCGYPVVAVGGTDKMSAATAVGSVRTYAKIDSDSELSDEAWKQAVRAMRAFVTYGPMLEFAAHSSPVMIEVEGNPFSSAADAVTILEQIEGALAYLDTVGTRAETQAYKRMRLVLESAHRSLHNRMHEHTHTEDHPEHHGEFAAGPAPEPAFVTGRFVVHSAAWRRRMPTDPFRASNRGQALHFARELPRRRPEASRGTARGSIAH